MNFKQFLNESNRQTLVANLQAKLSEQYPVKLALTVNHDKLELVKIIVDDNKRNQGTGSKVMKDIIKFADQNEMTIVLTPSSDFGGNKAKLINFYKKFGFVENKGRNKDYEISDTMYRECR